jgi:hypothetical protein
VDLIFAEVDAAVRCWIRRQNREHDLLVLVAGDWTHQKNVGLIVAVLAEVNAFRLLTDLIGPAILRRQGEAVGEHHNGANLQRNLAAICSDLLDPLLVRDLHAGLEDAVRKNSLGYFSLGEFLGEVAIRANDLACCFARTVVILLSPEGIGPAGGRGDQYGQAENQ